MAILENSFSVQNRRVSNSGEYKLAVKIVDTENVKALYQLSHDARTKNESNFKIKFNVTAWHMLNLLHGINYNNIFRMANNETIIRMAFKNLKKGKKKLATRGI